MVKQPKSEDECYEDDTLTKKYPSKKRPSDEKKRRKAERALKRNFD